ncbi:MAG: DsbA family protein [Elusimicrobia bacterium]|nr:DsbA family protein [Elusimicrobiota bacterium]
MPQGVRRRLVSGLVLAVIAVAVVYAVRGFGPQAPEKAPSFREEGPANAPVVIAEFSDFECPACRAAEPTVRQILALYGSRVRFVFKQFPLEKIHPWALQAALDAECAGREGKFWPFHDLLYDHQDDWVYAKSPKDALLKFARQAGLEPAKVKACAEEPGVLASVNADIAEGNRRWVGATPTFFINGKRFVGMEQLAGLGVPWIDRILKEKK